MAGWVQHCEVREPEKAKCKKAHDKSQPALAASLWSSSALAMKMPSMFAAIAHCHIALFVRSQEQH